MSTSQPIDVWLRFAEPADEEPDAEANTYREGGTSPWYRVEWYLTSVGLVKGVTFPTYEAATAWLESEGFTDYTS